LLIETFLTAIARETQHELMNLLTYMASRGPSAIAELIVASNGGLFSASPCVLCHVTCVCAACDCGHYYNATVALAVFFSILVVVAVFLAVLLVGQLQQRQRHDERSYRRPFSC